MVDVWTAGFAQMQEHFLRCAVTAAPAQSSDLFLAPRSSPNAVQPFSRPASRLVRHELMSGEARDTVKSGRAGLFCSLQPLLLRCLGQPPAAYGFLYPWPGRSP